MSPIHLRVADLGVRAEGMTADVESALRQRYAAFLADDSRDLQHVAAVSVTAVPDGVFEDGGVEARTVRSEGAGVRVARHDFDVTLQPGSQGWAATGRVNAADAAATDSVIRLVLGAALLDRDRLLLHGAAVAWRDRGIVGFGRSGAGKTTLATLAAGRGGSILGDDLVVIGPSGTGVTVWGTPFAGGDGPPRGRPETARVAALLALVHADTDPEDRILPLTGPEGVQALLRCTVAYRRDPRGLTRLLEVAEAVVAAAPVARLVFRPRPGVVKLLQRRYVA